MGGPTGHPGVPPSAGEEELITKWVTAKFCNEIAELPTNSVPRFVHRKPAESLRNRRKKLRQEVAKSLWLYKKLLAGREASLDCAGTPNGTPSEATVQFRHAA